MSRFITTRDHNFFQGINSELINNLIETAIIIYKVTLEDNEDDIYEEQINKRYDPGVILNCLIDKDAISSDSDEFGTNISQTARYYINRQMISDKGIYPEIGDIIEWNGFYYQIDNVNENQYLAGRPEYNHSLIIDAHLTNKAQINIENRF